MLNIYRRIEDWHGYPRPRLPRNRRPGLCPARPRSPTRSLLPRSKVPARSGSRPSRSQNGRMMEGDGGASIMDLRVRDGYRQSVFRSYVFPYLDRPNLTVLTGALVTRVTFDRFERNRVTGVEFSHDGTIRRVARGIRSGAVARRDPHPQGADAVGHRRPGRIAATSASPSCSIYRASAKTFKTILLSIVSGSIQRPLPPRNTAV